MVYSILFQSFIYLSATLIAIAAGVLLPDLAQPDLTVPTMVTKLLPPLVGGIIIAAVLGAMMSTIDSILLLAGSLVVENIYGTFRKELDPKKGLKIARYVTLVIGVLALLVAIKPPAAILWIVTMAFSLMASAVTFPFLLGLWWPGATREGGITAMIGGAISCVFWYVIGYMKYQSFSNWIGGIWPAIFGAAVSLVLILVVSRFTSPTPKEVKELFFE